MKTPAQPPLITTCYYYGRFLILPAEVGACWRAWQSPRATLNLYSTSKGHRIVFCLPSSTFKKCTNFCCRVSRRRPSSYQSAGLLCPQGIRTTHNVSKSSQDPSYHLDQPFLYLHKSPNLPQMHVCVAAHSSPPFYVFPIQIWRYGPDAEGSGSETAIHEGQNSPHGKVAAGR